MKHILRLLALCLALVICLPYAAAERLDDDVLLSFYSNSTFFGDSRMQAFARYRREKRQEQADFLADTKVVCVDSIGLYMGSRNFVNPNCCFSYRGMDGTIYNIAKQIEPAKIFVMLGVNDHVAAMPDKALHWAEQIITGLKQQLPDVEIYFFSETPVGDRFEPSNNLPDYRHQLDEYNIGLREICESNGAGYIEIAEALKGEDGLLKKEYASDRICHMNVDGVECWIECMKDFAQEQYDLGRWNPFAE